MTLLDSDQYQPDSDTDSFAAASATETISPPPTYQQSTIQHQRSEYPDVYTDPTDEPHMRKDTYFQDSKPWPLEQQQRYPYHRDAPPRTSSTQQYGAPGLTSSTSTEDSRQRHGNPLPSFRPRRLYGGVQSQPEIAPVQSNRFHPYLQPKSRGRPGYPQPQTSPPRTANPSHPDFEHATSLSQPHTHSQTRAAAGSPPTPCSYPNCGAPVVQTETGELSEYCGEEHMLCVHTLGALTRVWC
jgi:hypothetical protein